VLTQANFNDVYPDPSTWRTFQFSSGPSDATCATAGVSLDWTQIGTLNADPHQISLVSANTFIARPQNNSGAAIPTGAITARFRLANWGSSPSGWEAGVDPNVLWSTIPGGDAVPTGGIINDDTLATNTTGNHFQWTVSGADLAAFQNGTRLLHQCMLVELTSSLANLQFANNSVRRNMDFVNASKFERQARLTIKGLKPIAPAGRDMYIWIETLNMPAKAVQGGPPPQLKTTIPGTPVTDPTRPPQIGVFKTNAAAPLPPAPGYNPPQDGKPVPVPDGEGLQALLAKGEVTQQQIEAVVPMYIAHVYHDTGQKLRFGGVDRPVLGTQDSFEYIVTHKGDLYGWEHQLTAQGSVLEQIAPDFYRIHDVPNDGTVTVTSTILALETAPSPLPWWWWIVALIILLLIVLWFLVKK
jgi:hypothetical protein